MLVIFTSLRHRQNVVCVWLSPRIGYISFLLRARTANAFLFSPVHATHVWTIARISFRRVVPNDRKNEKNFQRQHVFAWKFSLSLSLLIPFLLFLASFLLYGLCLPTGKTRSYVCVWSPPPALKWNNIHEKQWKREFFGAALKYGDESFFNNSFAQTNNAVSSRRLSIHMYVR